MSNKEPVTYLHSKKCLADKPIGVSPKAYARTQVGLNESGEFEVWCNRHNISVAVLTDDLKKSLGGAVCHECGCSHSGHVH